MNWLAIAGLFIIPVIYFICGYFTLKWAKAHFKLNTGSKYQRIFEAVLYSFGGVVASLLTGFIGYGVGQAIGFYDERPTYAGILFILLFVSSPVFFLVLLAVIFATAIPKRPPNDI